jgi:hypothetical protein
MAHPRWTVAAMLPALVACSALFLGVSAVQWALWQWVA